MPSALRKLAISFGMVHIPVSLYSAVQEKGIGFNQITPDGARVRQKRVREDTGAEVEARSAFCTSRRRAASPPFITTNPTSAPRTAATRRMSFCAAPCWRKA